MLVLGITGGVGAGKSTVLQYMEEAYGARILQADLVAHRLMEPGEACYRQIVQDFGREIVGSNGAIDRKKLGDLVFGREDLIGRMNQIIHPAVERYIMEEIRAERSRGTRLMAIEAALLVECGYDKICDELWYIYASEEIRRDRLKKTRNYSDERVDQIFASQLTEEEFRAGCQEVIDTGISLECTKKQADDLLAARQVHKI